MVLKRSFYLSIGLLIALLVAACGGSSPTTVVIKTATATIQGKSETILTDVNGKTLYYFTPDSATTAACTGSCAQTWPPMLLSSGTPGSSTSLSGTLSTVTDTNGTQVEYNGHPLYTFSGDAAAGQTNGEGISGKWFVATPSITSQGGGSTSGGY